MTSTHPLWPAPFRGKRPVDAVVTIPGSKSVTNRALILAAQATSPSIIRKPLVSRDSELMSAGLVAMGLTIESKSDSSGDYWVAAPSAHICFVEIPVNSTKKIVKNIGYQPANERR